MAQDYEYGDWLSVVLSVALFALFVLLLPCRKKTPLSRTSNGILVAFFIALLAEMYGFPLTVYILS